MDSEEDYDDDDALAALDGALDDYAAGDGTGALLPQPVPDLDRAGDFEMDMAGFDQLAPTLGPNEVERDDFDGHGHGGGSMTYDFPGNAPDDYENPMARSMGSAAGLGGTSTSLPEEIDVTTHGLIDETVQRLSFIHGVLGVLIIDRDGLIVHATMPPEEAAQLSGPVLSLLQRARSIAAVTPDTADEDFRMLCVRTRKYDMLLCSEQAGAFAICVLQDPQPENAQTSLIFSAGSAAARSILRGGAIAPPATGMAL